MEPREWQKPTSEYSKDPPGWRQQAEPVRPVPRQPRRRPHSDAWARYTLAFILGAFAVMKLYDLVGR